MSNGVASTQCLIALAWNNTYQLAQSRLLPLKTFQENFAHNRSKVMSQLGKGALSELSSLEEIAYEGGSQNVAEERSWDEIKKTELLNSKVRMPSLPKPENENEKYGQWIGQAFDANTGRTCEMIFTKAIQVSC